VSLTSQLIVNILLSGEKFSWYIVVSDEEFDKLEITYWIGREYWGKGFAYARSEEIEEYILKLEASETGNLIDLER